MASLTRPRAMQFPLTDVLVLRLISPPKSYILLQHECVGLLPASCLPVLEKPGPLVCKTRKVLVVRAPVRWGPEPPAGRAKITFVVSALQVEARGVCSNTHKLFGPHQTSPP